MPRSRSRALIRAAAVVAWSISSANAHEHWRAIALDDDVASTPHSHESVAYVIDDDSRVRARGWFRLTRATSDGEDVFASALPVDARPRKDTRFVVTMKGSERVVMVTTNGGLELRGEYDAGTWFTLRGLEYESTSDAKEERARMDDGECIGKSNAEM